MTGAMPTNVDGLKVKFEQERGGDWSKLDPLKRASLALDVGEHWLNHEQLDRGLVFVSFARRQVVLAVNRGARA